ncbi:MFS transporter [Clostridium grantii]|uniref:MFS transporter, YQGE family, putative transporter n=1 Tax=Clostridium grantii DSM 8605 TaxID=1121316 RepID=A0A1M5W108_9CLOT|nr:MFS transporter [Clostridium grantii]SHH81151.1 MFS transporter, YQGE family, putative transporter [Clostridium grantii DSM 8605]
MCRKAKILIIISGLFTFAMGLSNIFINVFFWNKTNDFKVIVVYNLMHYIFTPITFVLAAYIAKKKNGIWPLRIGLFIYAIFYLLILSMGEKGIGYIYFLGIVYGLACGFYWLAFNTLSFELTSLNNRDTFNGYNGCCAGIAAAIAPITSAFIITSFNGYKGYKIVFLLTLSMFVLLFFMSSILKCDYNNSKLNIKEALHPNFKQWEFLKKSIFFWGFRDVIIIFIINILVIETVKSELFLGKLTLMASVITSSSYILVQKIIKPPLRKKAILLGTLGSFFAVLGLTINVSKFMLMIYVVMDAFFLPFFIIQQNSSTFNLIDKSHNSELRMEYIINKDIYLNLGRIISSTILLIVLMIFKDFEILKAYLFFIALSPIVAGYYLRKII